MVEEAQEEGELDELAPVEGVDQRRDGDEEDDDEDDAGEEDAGDAVAATTRLVGMIGHTQPNLVERGARLFKEGVMMGFWCWYVHLFCDGLGLGHM